MFWLAFPDFFARFRGMRRLPLSGALCSLLAMLGSGFALGQSDDVTTRPGTARKPVPVAVEMLILDLQEIRGSEQSFSANIAVEARWRDERLQHDGQGEIRKSLSEIWNPGLQFLNRGRLQSATFADEVRIAPDGTVSWLQRILGQFTQPLQLADFPFDTQDLRIVLVATGHEPGTVQLVEDPERPSRVSKNLTIPDWDPAGWKVEIAEETIAGGRYPIPVFTMTLTMRRDSQYYFINVILPLVLIIGMSWIVFWIPSAQLGPRVSVSVTAMLTLTAYRFAIGSGLPRISYLTRLDWFILCSSLLIFLSLVEVVVTSWLMEREKAPLARRINYTMRWLAPALLLLIGWITLF